MSPASLSECTQLSYFNLLNALLTVKAFAYPIASSTGAIHFKKRTCTAVIVHSSCCCEAKPPNSYQPFNNSCSVTGALSILSRAHQGPESERQSVQEPRPLWAQCNLGLTCPYLLWITLHLLVPHTPNNANIWKLNDLLTFLLRSFGRTTSGLKLIRSIICFVL